MWRGDVARGQRRAQKVGQPPGNVGDAAAKQKMHRLVVVAASRERVGLGQQDLRRTGIRVPCLFRLCLLARAPPRRAPCHALGFEGHENRDDRDADDHRAPEQVDHVRADLRQCFQKRPQPFRRLGLHQRRQVKLDGIVRKQLLVYLCQPFGVLRL
ncbi:hypothetical protein [Mesorhizobium intechi]|uniref:hypothetical protein n=1 Tax=Mesorhizobium intechi TaxID=537601 RepID=UPI001FEAEDE7|nr:hypothetical protein [Mesorhizobium intechi]